MKQPWEHRRDLKAARAKAEEEFLAALYQEAFQRGVERGRFESRMDVRLDQEKLKDELIANGPILLWSGLGAIPSGSFRGIVPETLANFLKAYTGVK